MGSFTDLFEQMDTQEKELLVLAAMLPPPLSLDTITMVSGLSPVKALQCLELFVDSGILKTYAQAGAGHYYFPQQKVAQKAVALSEPPFVEAQAHKLIEHVSVSEQTPHIKSLILTNIYCMSGVKDKQAVHVLRAAEYCLKHGARQAATDYFQVALEILSQQQKQDIPAFIDATLGIVASHGHRMPLVQQKAMLSKARHTARETDDLARLCKIDLRLAQVEKSAGDYPTAGKLFEEAWDLANRLEIVGLLKEAALFSTDFLFWQGRVADAVARYEEVIGNLEEFPADEATLRACAALGWCYGITGQTARGLGLIEATRERAKHYDFPRVRMYADLMSVLTLLEARRLPEAEGFLEEILKHSEEELGNYILWAAYASRAFLLFTQGDLEGCFVFQKKAYAKSNEIGWPHHRGPYNFDYMDALEDAGMVHPQMNYESELERIANWPDIYMQGVGLRYKAIRILKKGGSKGEALRHLEKSQEMLIKAGANLELSRTQIELARQYLVGAKNRQAQDLLKKAYTVLSLVNDRLFQEELKPYLEIEQGEDRLLSILMEVGNAIGTVRNRNRLLERIINLLMKLTLAGRGGFFSPGPGGRPQLVASRNLDKTIVASPQFRSSYKMILRAVENQNQTLQLVPARADEDRVGKNQSGWALCSIVALQERVLGVIYLDNNLVNLSPPDKELAFLRVINNQVAVALDNARAYEEISLLKDRLEDETRIYRMELECSPDSGQIVGRSRPITNVLAQINRVAPSEPTVLITGETGVGKDLVARAIHAQSTRRAGPFIPVNTASLDPGVVASELFGHEKGAFTGAVKTRRGRFELADKGTLFLDDVDNLSLDIQAKILRTIQDKEFERVGGDRIMKSDFRLIAATNRNLEKLVEEGGFRSDLYFRLTAFPIHVPPLRERKDDIPLLVAHFLDKYTTETGKDIDGISKPDMQNLTDYNWPGNVRELKHIIERAVILSDGQLLDVPDLTGQQTMTTTAGRFLPLKEMEKAHIIEALRMCNGRVSGKGAAAELLEIKPSTLYSKIRKLGINKNLSYE